MIRRAKYLVALAGGALCACRQDMFDQPRYKPLAASTFFDNGAAARQPVAGTVPRGQLGEDELFLNGTQDGRPADRFPYPVSAPMLRRGQERFTIYCAPCHGLAGYGDGIIVAHGFPAPPSYHLARLRAAPAGHFVQVARNGFGAMFAYGDRVDAGDRWAIAAYIRALQYSQHAPLGELPPEDRQRLATERRP